MVTSPDQHKPGHAKAARVLGIGSAIVLLLFLRGNHQHRSHVENVWLIGLAVGLILVFVIDWVLRRNGLRR